MVQQKLKTPIGESSTNWGKGVNKTIVNPGLTSLKGCFIYIQN